MIGQLHEKPRHYISAKYSSIWLNPYSNEKIRLKRRVFESMDESIKAKNKKTT
ncbi:MAG: hypothetical protein HPY63_02985 [Methanobacteriaceae archaeon]|nr:hypothetical protein [Methanobacteriaceae archaeon]